VVSGRPRDDDAPLRFAALHVELSRKFERGLDGFGTAAQKICFADAWRRLFAQKIGEALHGLVCECGPVDIRESARLG